MLKRRLGGVFFIGMNIMHLAILMRSDLNMRTGKMIAQGGHAAMMVGLARFERNDAGNLIISAEDVSDLREFLKYPDVEVSFAYSQEMLLDGTHDDTDFHVVVDSGRTEFRGLHTMTCGASGVFPAQQKKDTPYAAPDTLPSSARQYLIMSREAQPLKQTAIAMAGLGCLTEIEKVIRQDPTTKAFFVDQAGQPDLFEWMGKGYPKIGLQVPTHEALKYLADCMTLSGINNTLVEYQGCMMVVTAPGAISDLAKFTGDLKLL